MREKCEVVCGEKCNYRKAVKEGNESFDECTYGGHCPYQKKLNELKQDSIMLCRL